MNDKIKDLLIVGMGLSGINVSYEARQRDLNVIHIHKAHKGDSTPVAAGLINPITGRRFVKSWWIDKVMPFAEHRYLDLEKLLGGSYLQKMNIVRVFHKPEDENNWLAKSANHLRKN